MNISSAYMNLAFAIVQMAIADYKKTVEKLRDNPENSQAKETKIEIDEFFRSSLFCFIADFDEDIRKTIRNERAGV